MTIIDAINHSQLFRPYFGGQLATWSNWIDALRVVYGLPVTGKSRAVVRECTGRRCRKMPPTGFDTALFLVGRRSGKSRIAAIVAAFEAAFAGHEKKLAPGERGMVLVLAPTKNQGRIVHGYIKAIFATPTLQQEIVGETQDAFELSNGVRIEITTGDHRAVRGYTLLAVVVDELAFFGTGDEAKVKNDTELIRAIKPGLATVGGHLIAITSPYARKGWCFRKWESSFGNDAATTLVWNCASRTMNPTLSQQVVDDALAEDLQAAKSEYLGEFRDDVAEFLPRSLIEALVMKDRKELLPRPGIPYAAFCDVSGGRADDASLAIGHRDGRKVVMDLLRRYRPPFSPQEVIVQMIGELQRYGVRRVTGDNYAAEFTARAFTSQGIQYRKCELAKGGLYLELLPRLCSGDVELLDDEKLVDQLATLERRTRSGGKDIVDHPAGGHDDLANAVAGLGFVLGRPRLQLGAFGVEHGSTHGNSQLNRMALGALAQTQRSDYGCPIH